MIKITNGKVFTKDGFKKRNLYISGDNIVSTPGFGNTIDASSCYVVPGFIDGHTHGRCGVDIIKTDKDGLKKLSEEYLKTGVTTVFPTIMTAPLDVIYDVIDNIKNTDTSKGSDFKGIHIEGPYISKEKPGCHDVSLIRKPEFSEIEEMCKAISPLMPRFTISPETCEPGVLKKLCEIANISIGHTNCTYEQAEQAVKDGALSFTHTFNAMSPITHRNPGCATSALSSEAYAEFICDGLHIDFGVIKMSFKAKTKYSNKFALITDSIPCSGLENGDYEMNGIGFHLDENGAKTPSGTLVGSTISMLDGIKNLVNHCNVNLYQAIESSTKIPAEMLKLNDRGTLEKGKLADIVILNDNLEIVRVIKHGEILI